MTSPADKATDDVRGLVEPVAWRKPSHPAAKEPLFIDAEVRVSEWEGATFSVPLYSASALTSLLERAERAEARVKELEQALEPFAAIEVPPPGAHPFSIPDGHALMGNGFGDNWRPVVTVADFRRARAVKGE